MSITSVVAPVVDYEPPVRAVPHHRPSPPVAPRSPRPARRRAAAHPPAAPSPALRAAGAFADAALRRVLEVIDRRRPLSQLHPLLSAGLIDSLSALRGAYGSRAGAAVLRRVRLQLIGLPENPSAAEVFGTYTRGRRTHAIACRLQPVPDSPGPPWQVVALHIG